MIKNKYGISNDDDVALVCMMCVLVVRKDLVAARWQRTSEQPDNPGAERYTKSHSSG